MARKARAVVEGGVYHVYNRMASGGWHPFAADPEPQLIRREADGSVLVSGAAAIRDVNRELDLELPDDGDWNTVAGLCLAVTGRIPVVGEVVTLPHGLALEVLDASPRRVHTVRLRPATAPDEATPPPGAGS